METYYLVHENNTIIPVNHVYMWNITFLSSDREVGFTSLKLKQILGCLIVITDAHFHTIDPNKRWLIEFFISLRVATLKRQTYNSARLDCGVPSFNKLSVALMKVMIFCTSFKFWAWAESQTIAPGASICFAKLQRAFMTSVSICIGINYTYFLSVTNNWPH